MRGETVRDQQLLKICLISQGRINYGEKTRKLLEPILSSWETKRENYCRSPDSSAVSYPCSPSTASHSVGSNGSPVPNLVRQVLQKQFIANWFEIPSSCNRTKKAQAWLQSRMIGRLRVGVKQDFPSAKATSRLGC